MGVHRFAVATALVTFCLLIAGGLVSTTESGLACPDWPLCEGHYFPKMIDGKQFEHGHRLTASLVSVMTVSLAALLLKHRRKDRLLTRLGVLAVGLVIAQALLGALTVKLKLPAWVSSTHQATAMAFFSLVTSLAFLTRQRMDPAPPPPSSDPRLRRWVLATAALCYAQIVFGAVMRHTRGGLACGFEFPLCLGQVWPVHEYFGVQAHLVHRWGGMIVGVAVIALATAIGRSERMDRSVKRAAAVAALGVVAQVGLGIATVLASRELVTMTVHSSLGAALLACLVSIYWLAYPSRLPAPSADAAVPPERSISLEPA